MILGSRWPHRMNQKVSHSFCRFFFFFFITGCRELVSFFLKCLVEFNSETIWVWCFLLWNVINYWFHFLIQVVYLSTCELWKILSFKQLVHYILISNLCFRELFRIFLYYIFNSIESVLMTPLSLLMLVICILVFFTFVFYCSIFVSTCLNSLWRRLRTEFTINNSCTIYKVWFSKWIYIWQIIYQKHRGKANNVINMRCIFSWGVSLFRYKQSHIVRKTL